MGRWATGLLLLCALLPFLPARNYPQVHDDVILRGAGSLVADARAGLPLLLRADLFGTWEEPVGQTGFWRPGLLLTYRAELALTGGDPAAATWLGHVVNLALHAGTTLALAWLLLALGLGPGAAVLGAGLFAVHPVHAESVAWISGRSDLAATLCGLLGLLAVLRSPATLLSRLAAPALFVAALLCKESAVLLVGLAVPLAALVPGRTGRDAGARSGLRAVAVALACYAALRLALFSGGPAPDAYTGPEALATRWLTWLSIVPDMLRLLLWPGAASPVHPVAAVDGFSPGAVLPGLAVLVLLALLAWRAWCARAAVPAFALLLVLGTLLLLAPWRRFPTGYADVAAPLYERYLYVAVAGPAALVAWLLRRPLQHRQALALGLTAVLALPLGWRARQASEAWSSDEAFARAGLAAAPRSADLWNHLGVALLEDQRAAPDAATAAQAGQAALSAFDRALVFDPAHAQAELNRFIALALLQQRDAAWAAADRLLQRHGDEPAVLENVAQWHVGEQRWERAAELFARALRTGHARPGTEEALAECTRRMEAAKAAKGAREAEPAADGGPPR